MPIIRPGAAWTDLGSYRFTGDLTQSPVLTFPAMEMLQVQFNITGYSANAIASLRFNGDTAVGNYNSSYSTLTSTTLTNTLGTQSMFRLGQNGVRNQRSGLVTIYNYSGSAHPITCQSITQSAGTTAPVLSIGGGNWNGTGQITSMQLITDVSGTTMPAGTSFAIIGLNP